MKFKVIASGSKGNMIYIETELAKVILDCGVSYGHAKLLLQLDEVDIDEVDFVICTHEHTDHVKELAMIMKKTEAELFINEKSFLNLKPLVQEKLANHNIKFIEANKIYKYKDLQIYTLQLSHDSANCLGFVFKNQNTMLGYVTDTGFIHVDYLPLLSKCSSLIIEANHNIEMLQESTRPIELKRRILSIKGHMSNQITYSILESIASDNIKNIILAHVSEDCNSDECIEEEIITKLKDKVSSNFVIAKQKVALPMMEV